MISTRLRLALALTTALMSVRALADAPAVAAPQGPSAPTPSLESQFRDPPNSARPRVWWHWMNGNVTKDGIAKDLAWMKRIGIGGMQNFDANQDTPQVVSNRLVYMSPEWKDSFRFAATEASRLGLELTISSSPGWSETGGPWVKPEDAMKKLVWSETDVRGGEAQPIRLPAPPRVPGSYQDLAIPKRPDAGSEKAFSAPEFYRDVAAFAYRIKSDRALPRPTLSLADGSRIGGAALLDASLATSISIPRPSKEKPATIKADFGGNVTLRSVTLFAPGSAATQISPGFTSRLEVSNDGDRWRKVVDIAIDGAPSTVSFDAVSGRYFRAVFAPAASNRPSMSMALPKGLDFSAAGGLIPRSAPGMTVAMLRFSAEPRVDRFETKAGFAVARDYFALDADQITDMRGIATRDVIDVTPWLHPDGTLGWKAPSGMWRIVRMGWSLTGKTNHPASAEATGLEVDKLDAGAVRRYLEYYLGTYEAITGARQAAQGAIKALLNDSTEVGAFNWTGDMVAQFTRRRGYDPRPWFPVLTGAVIGSRGQSDAFLYDYRRTIGELHADAHYRTIAEFAHAHGLKVYGEALENGRETLGDDMALRSHADFPMGAMWYIPRSAAVRPAFLADLKGASSVAHVYGQNVAAAESMTSIFMPWALAPADLRRTIDLEFVNGINLPVIHTSVHQPVDDKVPGLSLGSFGQFFNRHETWAEMARPWMDYIARNALLLQQGRNVADVGYFYGEEAPLTGLYGEAPVADAPTRYAYDFVNVDALVNLLRNDGAELTTPGGARYRVLYLGGSSRMMTLATLRKVAALVEGGATIVGGKPQADPGLGGDQVEYARLTARLWAGDEVTRVGKGQVIASTDIEAALARIGATADFSFTGGSAKADIPFVHRRIAEGDSYFLVNRGDANETIEARFRVTGKAPELWHADSGKSKPVSYRIENGETVVPLNLSLDDSVHVVFRKPATADRLTVPSPALITAGAIHTPWRVTFQTGRGAPASTTMPALKSLSESGDTGIQHFSGVATYAADLKVSKPWKPGRPLWLDLGDVREVAEVLVNGKSAGYAWHRPYRVDIGSVARRGTNRLEVRVANLWVNRLIGDKQPGAKKITWTAIPTYTASAPLRPSGLIGPVQLLATPEPRDGQLQH